MVYTDADPGPLFIPGRWPRTLNVKRCDRRGPSRLGQATGRETVKKGGETMLSQTNTRGQGLVEYALILVLVAVVVILILGILGNAIGNVFSNILHWI
jgi:pilus assembly protein Flp/PilA